MERVGSMEKKLGVVHGPGPWSGPLTPVHVLYKTAAIGKVASKILR